MPQIIECVPNFSEGRDPAVVQALIVAVKSVPGIWLLDHTMDTDHHRSVLTFAGAPDAVGKAALRAITVATELIDLRRHEGVHPRIGATDVVPFVPLSDVTMDECVRVAYSVGQEVGARLGIPVFFYEQAASNPKRRQLESIRLGGLQGLVTRMESDPAWLPDFGPPRPHETAGAIVIGARQPLIAFNVNLNTPDLTVAEAIAKTVRHSNGGLPCLKAIGVKLASRGMVQVAMNLTDYRVSSMHAAFQVVKTEATKRGVEVAGSELIGLVPQAALDETAAASLRLERFDPAQVLETRIAAAMSSKSGTDPTLSDFLNTVAAAEPTPAGGSVAALVGALAASLGVMGARLGHHTKTEQSLTQLRRQLHQLIQADVEAYDGLSEAYKIPKHHPDRPKAISVALHKATEVPLEIAELACEVGQLIHSSLQSAKSAVHSDLTVGMILSIAVADAGIHTTNVNLKLQTNHQLNHALLSRIRKAERSLEELKGLCYTPRPDT
ncbi:MAG: glutamate formimidoyltransferase [Nitrospirae bacterium]|nr:glutamate formimidoyltransferase [Nitrospirota bacterium]